MPDSQKERSGSKKRSIADEVVLHAEEISQAEREARHLQKGAIVWLTGLSGAGKTTLASRIERILFDQNKMVYMMDGDKVRQGLNSDLGYSAENRCENIRRIGEVARLFSNVAFLVIVAFISPFRKDRDRVRKAMEPGRFVEVFVDCPLEICEKRDTKGLYKKARAKLIEDFTGISSPYEPPLSPEIHLKTDQQTIENCTKSIMDYLENSRLIHI